MDIETPKIDYISSIPSITKEYSGLKFKKSMVSQNSDITLLCFINDDGDCGCLTYNINTHSFSNITIYLNNCLKTKSSFNIIYPSNYSDYYLYCYISEVEIELVKFSSNFEFLGDEYRTTCNFNDLNEQCNDFYVSSLVYKNFTVTAIITCDSKVINYKKIKEEIPTTIPSTIPTTSITTIYFTENYLSSTFVSVEEDGLTIIQKNTDKTLKEIIDNIDNGLDDYEIGKVYEIFNDNYDIKISPMNTDIYQNISTYIDFGNCEDILIETNNLNESSALINSISNRYL